MRLEIRYLNEFRYREPATKSHNLLRACPAINTHQRLEHYQVQITPRAKIYSYTDFWGTRVDEFAVQEPHHLLRVSAESVVETQAPPAPVDVSPMSAYANLMDGFVAYLRPSPHVRWNQSIWEMTRDSARGLDSAVSVITAVADTVTSTLEYRPGATFVGMDLGDVLVQGKGVCQDFAHLGIAMCRSIGIPARYVSGYLYAASQTAAVAPHRAELDVQTHAWMEVFVPGHGWWGLDPTNPQPVGELHVKIGHGRDYEDVMPLRGVYHGGVEHELGVHVSISRESLGRTADQ